MHESISLNIGTFDTAKGMFLIGINERLKEPLFFRSSKQKFKIHIRADFQNMRLEAVHNDKVVAISELKKAPTYDDYCELFITAVKLLVKRQPVVVGYTFILE